MLGLAEIGIVQILQIQEEVLAKAPPDRTDDGA